MYYSTTMEKSHFSNFINKKKKLSGLATERNINHFIATQDGSFFFFFCPMHEVESYQSCKTLKYNYRQSNDIKEKPMKYTASESFQTIFEKLKDLLVKSSVT